jgi:hypothetical protein
MKTKCYKLERSGTFKRGCTDDEKFCTEEKSKDPKAQCTLCEKELCNGAEENYLNAFMLIFAIVFQFFWILK